MAEVNDTASGPSGRGGTGFELRLERGGASVRLADAELAPGLRVDVLALRLPDVKFPFDVGLGAAQFRHRLSDLAELRLSAAPAFLEAALSGLPLAGSGLDGVRVAVREGHLEIAGRLAAGAPFTLRAGLVPAGDRGVRLLFHAPRIWGPAPVPAALLPHLAARALAALGEAGLPGDPVAPVLRQILAPRGWKLPRASAVRLSRAEITGGALRLAWDQASAGPPVLSASPDLLAAEDGARVFATAEAALVAGDYAAAREALLAAGAAATAHPFGAERLLSLLVLEERLFDEALDVAAEWLARSPGFAPAVLAEAQVRLARGEPARAARAFAALAAEAAARGDGFAALAAAEAAFGLPGAAREDAQRAVEVALSLRRDHVPALRALRGLAAAAGDREALLRADRRLVAYEPEDAGKARAHAELGELLLTADPPAARLHLDQALRLAPDDPTALAVLARACAAAGEPNRAVRALDRLAEVHRARGDEGPAARAAAEAGALWEGPLAHPENALLRYRAAAAGLPPAEALDAHARAARAAGALGLWTEAADHHGAVLATVDVSTPVGAALAARTRLALADVAEHRLGDPAAAAAHLEAAAAADPTDATLLARLAGLARTLGRPAALAGALEKLAALPGAAGASRGALLAEAGDALAGLGRAPEARARFAAALEADPACRPALEGKARLAREAGDAGAEREALARLAPLASDPVEAAALLDRLAAAAAAEGDLGAARDAATRARLAAPTADRFAAELALARRAGDGAAVARLLDEGARAAAARGEPAAAAAAWLERARLLGPDDPAGAFAALAAARDAAPGEPAVLRAQAELAERGGDHRLALSALAALLAGHPDDAGPLALRAALAARAAGEPAAAREHALAAEALAVPGAPELLEELLATAGDVGARGRVLERSGQHALAAACFEEAGDLDRALAAWERAADDPDTTAAALPRLADLRLSGGDARGAALALVREARLAGGAAGARLAWRAAQLDPDGPGLDVAAACDPRFAPARARRAAQLAGVDPRGALEEAEAALEGDGLPADERPRLLALAAGAAAASGDGAAARRFLSDYCEAEPADDAALTRLAALHRRAGDTAGLASALERRIALADAADAADARDAAATAVEREDAGDAETLAPALSPGDAARPDPVAPRGSPIPGAGEAGGAATALRLELAELVRPSDPARAAALAAGAWARDPSSLPGLAALRLLLAPAAAPFAGPRLALLEALAAHPATPAGEAAAALEERAHALEAAGDAAGALAALRAAGERVPASDAALERIAELATRAGAPAEAARALLVRAERARERGEDGAADRLAEAGLAALAAGLPGAEAALEAALALGPDPERARPALQALVTAARDRADVVRERASLAPLVPLLPTGEKPAALLRLAALARDAGDPAAARIAADEARLLAPRDPVAVEAARDAARAVGDHAAVAERLAELALLQPAEAGRHLLARARLLAGLARPDEADLAWADALAALPADRVLADEHARFRREQALPAAAEPLERFARRASSAQEAARAFRTAAALSFEGGETGAALRSARRAFARTQDDLGFAGPLLARILYEGGARAEALVLHRRLLEHGLAKLPPADALAVARQLAELAEDAGERDLARSALDEAVARRPQDLSLSLQRFLVAPDLDEAAGAFAAAAAASGSEATRAGSLLLGAEAAQRTGHRAAAEALFAAAARGVAPARAADVAARRAEAVRRAEGERSVHALEALRDAAAAALDAGLAGRARALYADAIRVARDAGRPAEAAQDLLQLDALAAAEGDFAGSAARAREAGALLLEAGAPGDAAEALARACAADPSDTEALRLLQEALRGQGAAGAARLAEVLLQAVDDAPAGQPRALAQAALAEALAVAGDAAGAEAALRAALLEDPAQAGARERLLALLAATGRGGERARLLLLTAARQSDPAGRAALRREAAAVLAGAEDAAERALAAEALALVTADAPDDRDAHRGAAALFLEAGRREEAAPHLAALVHADPEDEDVARELSELLSDRHAERAALWRDRASAATGEVRARRLREALRAYAAAGDAEGARAAIKDAFEASPADPVAFVDALRDAAGEPDRLDTVLRARAGAAPGEAASCHLARADVLLACGDGGRAVEAYEAAVAAAPGVLPLRAALAAAVARVRGDGAALGLDASLLAGAARDPGALTASAVAASRYRLGLDALSGGRTEEGLALLERALAQGPNDERAGRAWDALARAHAARGEPALALAAARARAERARVLGQEDERALALEAGAGLALALGAEGADAAELLEGHALVRAGAGAFASELERFARRGAELFEALGEAPRARALRSRCGVAPKVEERSGELRTTLAAVATDVWAEVRGGARGSEPAGAYELPAGVEGAAAVEAGAATAGGAEVAPGVEAAAGATAETESERDAFEAASQVDAAADIGTGARAGDDAGAGAAVEAAVDDAPSLGAVADPSDAPEIDPIDAHESDPTDAHEAEAAISLDASDLGPPSGAPGPIDGAPGPLDALDEARAAIGRALDEGEPVARAAGLLDAADALHAAGAPDHEIRAVLDVACETDPDHAAPWLARARLESAMGDSLAAARAHLSVSIRAAGDVAAEAALAAARIFQEAGLPAEAARAWRAAVHARPGCVPARMALATDALAGGDDAAAVRHLEAIDEGTLPDEVRGAHAALLAKAKGAAAPAVEKLDPVAAVLRAQAAGATDDERAELFERLAGHLERAGDPGGAADALLEGLAADPTRDLTWSWFESLAENDPDRLARGAALRPAPSGEPSFEEELAARVDAAARPPEAGREELQIAADAPPSTPAPIPAAAAAASPEAPAADAEPPSTDPFDGAEDLPPEALPLTTWEPPPAPEPPIIDAAAVGRTHMAEREWLLAHDWLAEALAREPSDLTIARDLGRVAEKLQLFDEYVQLGELCADAIAAYDPLAAAARFRHFAEVLRGKLDAPERAAVMLEKALALVPDDADTRRALVAAWGERPRTAPRALDAWLELARHDPADAGALLSAASLCHTLAAGAGPADAARLAERGRLAGSLAAFLRADAPASGEARLPAELPPEFRERVAAPGATGPTARLLSLLAPWLEPLFPADLARRGATPADRLQASSAPELHAALVAAARALSARPHAAFLAPREGLAIAVENTQPPALVFHADVAGLPDAGLAFLAARTLDLVGHGWALAGKFAPKDVAILLELACRTAGATPPARGLPAERAGAFLAVLEKTVPPSVREQASVVAPAAALELAEIDPRALAAALRRTANRVALLYAGDPGAALRVLAALDRRLEGTPDPAQALALPDLRDLALFALSEPFLDLRLALLG